MQTQLHPQGAQPPKFWPIFCGQTSGWIKMPLGTEVGLGPDHIVLDGDTATLPEKMGTAPPNFRSMSVVAKRLDDQEDAIWYGGRPRPRRHCVS